MEMFLLPLVAIILLSMPLIPVIKRLKTGKQKRMAIIFNLCAFFGIMLIGTIIPLGGFVHAAGETAAAGKSVGDGLGFLGAALSTGLSALGAGIAVASGSSAAIGAVSEDPKNLAKALIFVALGEGVALYGLLISILIIGKL